MNRCIGIPQGFDLGVPKYESIKIITGNSRHAVLSPSYWINFLNRIAMSIIRSVWRIVYHFYQIDSKIKNLIMKRQIDNIFLLQNPTYK